MTASKIVNFRDIGGIPVAGGTLRPGIFLRSGQLVDLTPEDVDFLVNQHHLKEVFDFRSKKEIEQQPDTTMPGVKYQNIDILASATNSSASIEDMLLHADNITEGMLNTYEQLVLSESAQKGYHDFLTEALKLNEPLLFHCFAGKDRTGFGAALILKLAGASDDQIYADYLKTNEMRKASNEEIINSLQGKISAEQIKALQVALNVDKSYLERAFATIDQHYGNFSNYLTEALDLDENFQTKFKQTFVIPE
ncbi:tyrosine-protein phosphatase [Fructilactobacillus carniphilus]|uniref:Tyrosine-protein phosphatase n=1 Tax=Fructilactobacillus carniphilus TaxID=2940297 RepID=A0ABY5BZ00_9LACO|nr:tyrosine-protein phosphatase [Fructilactobacillus carniphilus]USS90265.1 tyrosine-protein phosphatase [Fructilactobacillus carniphilus]